MLCQGQLVVASSQRRVLHCQLRPRLLCHLPAALGQDTLRLGSVPVRMQHHRVMLQQPAQVQHRRTQLQWKPASRHQWRPSALCSTPTVLMQPSMQRMACLHKAALRLWVWQDRLEAIPARALLRGRLTLQARWQDSRRQKGRNTLQTRAWQVRQLLQCQAR